MNIEEIKIITVDLLNKEELGDYTLIYFEFSEEDSNHRYDTYVGDISYIDDDDGKEVFLIFNLIVYKNGKITLEWS